MTAQIEGDHVTRKTTAKRPYPGATLRYLGSMRDVTLAKTHGATEPFGTKPRLP